MASAVFIAGLVTLLGVVQLIAHYDGNTMFLVAILALTTVALAVAATRRPSDGE